MQTTQPEPQAAATEDVDLPRLLYIGDVAVESTAGGQALLYRLLEQYPAQRLRIAQSSLFGSIPERRIAGVRYDDVDFGSKRMLQTRFAAWYSAYLLARASRYSRTLAPIADEFGPQAVLTVVHRFLWRTAAALAERRGIPLHLIVHDHVHQMAQVPAAVGPWLDRAFRRTFRAAASVLCVSPHMAELYAREYGVRTDVLYPSRAADAPQFDAPPERLGTDRGAGGLTFAYAGTVNTVGMGDALVTLAELLGRTAGRLVMYSPVSADSALGRRLADYPNVEIRPMVPFKQLIHNLREQADVLYCPMSFDPVDRPNMEASFPSKLTDYTAVGLPLLVWGPPYCSAVKWAADNPGVAELLDNAEPAALRAALERLRVEPGRRVALGARVLEVGETYFSYSAGARRLRDVLTRRGGWRS